MKSLFSSISATVDTLKNIMLCVLLLYALLEGRLALKTIFAQIASGARVVSEAAVTKEGLTIKLAEATRVLTSAANDQGKTEGKQDQPPSPVAKDILEALTQTKSALAEVSKSAMEAPAPVAPSPSPISTPSVWVYLGIEKNGNWKPNYFNLSGAPKIGESIKASTEVYKRNAKPIYVKDLDDWKLGKIVGLLHSNEPASIQELDSIEADNGGMIWWARIQ